MTMATIKKITDKQGNDIYLRTHTKAVVDDNGYTAESRLQAMQDEINAKQMELGAVPSDLTPTEDSSNWVTSDGVFKALNKLSKDLKDTIGFRLTIEEGFYISDSKGYIGFGVKTDGTVLGGVNYRIIKEF